ncbi:hypothetical protein K474DRAFT_88311 [Panus rudis PR-1116 ss-1]|nr:hypothetical protein K474DRAFT_88311 [Panus rudis PR-1116 ss-1]
MNRYTLHLREFIPATLLLWVIPRTDLCEYTSRLFAYNKSPVVLIYPIQLNLVQLGLSFARRHRCFAPRKRLSSTPCDGLDGPSRSSAWRCLFLYRDKHPKKFQYDDILLSAESPAENNCLAYRGTTTLIPIPY